MKVYHNGETFAVIHENGDRGGLVLIGSSLNEHETESKIFYYDKPMYKFLEDNGYKKIKVS